MPEQVPSLKAKAEWIPPALQMIRDNEGNYETMQEAVASYWQKVSVRVRSPSKRNSLRAVFGPTLRHLQLISGEGDSVRLTSKGNEVLKAWESGGDTAFKKAFARHLVKLDKDRWVGLIFELQKHVKPVDIDEFLEHLKKKYPDSDISKDKLQKLLRNYYEYVGLVQIEEASVVLRKRQLEILVKGIDFVPSEQGFLQALLTAYEELQKEASGNPYIPIPHLREKTCSITGMWPDDFDKLMMRIPKETSDYIIHLTQPMLRKPGGIRFAGKYLYFIAIFRKGKKNNEEVSAIRTKKKPI